MNIEEKAKRYDLAIEVAEKYHNGTLKDVMENIFPELKESEDERIIHWIRKELEDKYVTDNIVNNVMADKVFAWLEKQEQHKKFRDGIQVGDKVTRNRDGMLVNLSQLNRVAKKDEKKGEQKPILDFNANDWYVSKVDNKIHNVNMIEKQDKQKIADEVKPRFKHGDRVRNKKSGLEQTLGSCIEDVYEGAFPFRIKDQDDWKLVEQKSAWSEEDEYQINTILHGIDLKRELYKKEGNKIEEDRYNTQYNWLKSLKDRYTWKPSDKQINALEYYIYSTSPTSTITKGTIFGNTIVELLEQLKKLKK